MTAKVVTIDDIVKAIDATLNSWDLRDSYYHDQMECAITSKVRSVFERFRTELTTTNETDEEI